MEYRKKSLVNWAKQLQEKIENDTQNFTDEAQHQEAVTNVATELEDIKNHLVDDRTAVTRYRKQ